MNLKRWMLFVDGENLTLRGQELAKRHSLSLREGSYYKPDVFVWFPKVPAQHALGHMDFRSPAIRAYYYTSAVGDDDALIAIRELLRHIGFEPKVFKKDRRGKVKGVDIMLTKDVLSHAFLNNYDAAVLFAGDGDYLPLIEEVKRLGKTVHLAFFKGEGLGLNLDLRLAADQFMELDEMFIEGWKQ